MNTALFRYMHHGLSFAVQCLGFRSDGEEHGYDTFPSWPGSLPCQLSSLEFTIFRFQTQSACQSYNQLLATVHSSSLAGDNAFDNLAVAVAGSTLRGSHARAITAVLADGTPASSQDTADGSCSCNE